MKNSGLRELLGAILRNKNIAISLLNSFRPEDIERGIIAIPESLVNYDFKMLIMDKATPYLNDYRLLINHGSFFLDLDINANQFGRLKAKYMLTVSEFDFFGDNHRIKFSYREDVKPVGNFMQSMAIKAAGLRGTYLQSVADMARVDFVKVEKDNFTIFFDRIKAMKNIPSSLTLNYLSCEDGILKIEFKI